MLILSTINNLPDFVKKTRTKTSIIYAKENGREKRERRREREKGRRRDIERGR